jgi:hypothetical protein
MGGKTGRGAGEALLMKTIFPVSECGVERPELSHRHGLWLYVNRRRHIVYKYISKKQTKKRIRSQLRLQSWTTLKLDNFDDHKKKNIWKTSGTRCGGPLPICTKQVASFCEAREQHNFNGAISSIATRTKCFSVVIIQYSVYEINARSAKSDFEVRCLFLHRALGEKEKEGKKRHRSR